MSVSVQIYLDTCDEPSLWYFIESLGGAIWWHEHDLADGRLESTPGIEKWLKESKKDIKQAADKTARFGIAPHGENGNSTAAYWDWYRRWKTKWNESDEHQRRSWKSHADTFC